MGDSCKQKSTFVTQIDSNDAYIEGISITDWQTLIHAIAETNVLEPDLHGISIMYSSEGQGLPEYTHLHNR